MSHEELFETAVENEGLEIDEVTYMEPEEESSSSISKIAIGIGLAVVGAAGVAWVKTKKLREERTIKRLEKAGYMVVPTVDVKEVVEVDVEEDFEDGEVSEK